MNTARRRIVTALGILLVGGTVFYWIRTRPVSLCTSLSCIRIPGASSYRLNELYTDTPTVYRALYTSGQRYIRIEAKHNDAIGAEQELDASVVGMKALFAKAPAPYPGDISDAIVCDPSFVPTYHVINGKDGPIRYFVGYLNNRMTFGSCSQSQAVYKGIMAFTYCKKEAMTIRTELIAETSDFTKNQSAITKQIETMSCPD